MPHEDLRAELESLARQLEATVDRELRRANPDMETVDFLCGLLDDADGLLEDWELADAGDEAVDGLRALAAGLVLGAAGGRLAGWWGRAVSASATVAAAVSAYLARRRAALTTERRARRTRFRMTRLRRELSRVAGA